MVKYKITGLKLSQLLTGISQKYLNAIIEEPEKATDRLSTGKTYLIPKSGDSKEVRNCPPITCLMTMCKTLTGIIAKRVSTHFEERAYYQHSKKDVTLEVKAARIS